MYGNEHQTSTLLVYKEMTLDDLDIVTLCAILYENWPGPLDAELKARAIERLQKQGLLDANQKPTAKTVVVVHEFKKFMYKREKNERFVERYNGSM
jgi:hypothetical protein